MSKQSEINDEENKMIRCLIHRAVVWYLRRCWGTFHTYPYGKTGRYVVLMDEQMYHDWKETV